LKICNLSFQTYEDISFTAYRARALTIPII